MNSTVASKCPYCLLRQAKERVVPIDKDICFVNKSCDACQKGVDRAIKRTTLLQRGLLVKYIPANRLQGEAK